MKKKKTRIKAKYKFAFILIAFLIALFVVLFRVAYIKEVHGEEYEAAAKEQQVNRYDEIIMPSRGSILDRNQQILAGAVTVYNLALDSLQLSELPTEKEKEKTLTTLCEFFPDLDYNTLKSYITINPETGEINLPTHWKYLKKEISRETKEAIEATGIKGIAFEDVSKRVYPLKSAASHVLGFTRGDSQWGIEKKYNDYMVGTPGRSFITYQDGDKVSYEDYAAVDGNTIISTLDYTIQQYAEEVVAETQAQWPSQNTAAIVMDSNTGEILAMAETNAFDLNNPSTPLAVETSETFKETWEAMDNEAQLNYLDNMWKCFTVSDTYEPGSIYKPLVIAAALEEGVITPSSTFYCGGSMDVAGHTIHCHLTSGHGTIDVEEIMAQSCNMGMIQIAQRLGADKFYDYQLDFGFGQNTGIDLPAEASGLLHSLSEIRASELATMSFGQTFNATSIQMITAFASLINGGNLVEPHVVSQVVDKSGNVVYENKTEVLRKVISQETSDYLRTALKATVERGTGKKIAIEGYSIGCKTGTGEQGSRARDDLWVLTYMAYFPAENPQYLVLTVMDKPEGYVDGIQTAAPMTKSLIEKIIKYKNLEATGGDSTGQTPLSTQTVAVPDYVGSTTFHVVGDLDAKELNYKVVGTGNTIVNQVPKAGTMVERGSEIILYVEKSENDSGKITVPNVVGNDYDMATDKLNESGFEVIFEGDKEGRVVKQEPQYGVAVEKGAEVKIILEIAATEEEMQ